MPAPKQKAAQKLAEDTVNLFFEDNALLPVMYGEQESHLKHIERVMGVELISRGNMLSITGKPRDVEATEQAVNNLYDIAKSGDEVTSQEVDAAIRMVPPVPDKPEKKEKKERRAQDRRSDRAHELEGGDSEIRINTLKKSVRPYSHIQANYMRSLFNSDMIFALGPAGTGKTYIAVAMAVNLYLSKKVERIILTRPAVEAGEKLGFLPGDLKDKIDPFLRPLYDALFDMMPAEKVEECMANGEIELAPLAFMRGRTLSNAAVILDEAQNTTPTQMKMFLTRMGENSRMLITGDLSQTDLPRDVKSGLRDCIPKVESIEGVTVIRFSETDVVRHELAARIVKSYDQWEAKKKARLQAAEAEADAELNGEA